MCLDVFLQFFEKKLPKNLVMSKKSSTFAPAFEKSRRKNRSRLLSRDKNQ